MVSLVALVVWRLPVLFVLAGFLVFGALDGLYLSSALTKVPDGAWFTLILAVCLSAVFVLWRFGKENQWRAEASDRVPPWKLLQGHQIDEKDGVSLGLRLIDGSPVSRLRGVGIFFDKTGSPSGTPSIFIHFLQKFQAAPEIVVFFHVRPLSTPTVDPKDRFAVTRCSYGLSKSTGLQTFFRVTIRHGYADQVITSDLGLLIYENIRDFIIREGGRTNAAAYMMALNVEGTSTQSSNPPSASEGTSAETELEGDAQNKRQGLVRQRLASLQAAYEDQVVHIVGKEQMRIGEIHHYKGWARRIALAAFLWLRSNTGSKVANMNLDVEKLVEVGFVKII